MNQKYSMTDTLIQRLEALISPRILQQEIKMELCVWAKLNKFRSGQSILREGEICRGAHFLVKGLARSYYMSGDKQVTSRLMAEGFIITSWMSFLRQQPSTEYIMALENCTTVYLSFDAIQQLYDRYPQFNEVGRRQVENSFYGAEQRTQMMRGHTAEERYQQFCLIHPELVNRVPYKYIASYLGMTDVTLSRIRGRMKKGQFLNKC